MLFLLRQALTKNEWLTLKISETVYSHRTECSKSELNAQGSEVNAMIDKHSGFK